MTNVDTYDVLIVGAGMGGLYSAYRLRELGFSVRVLEAGDGVGGTWYWNRYPGARCDVNSVDYSFSFSSELQDEWDWTERYATQAELERYFNHVADRFELRELIDLRTRVDGARFDETGGVWRLATSHGDYAGRYLVLATGPLSQPNKPDFPGLDCFSGRVFHSAEWPAEPVDFSGRRVGVIGTGSTGIQIIPTIADVAEELLVFQRTPNYSVPAQNHPMTAEMLAEIRAGYAERRAMARNSVAGFPPRTPPISASRAMDVTPEQRREVYELMWEQGGGLAFRAAFADLLIDPEANETAAEFIRSKIRSVVTDPEVAELLTPRDHPYASKRPPVDIGYYETFNRPNVSLIDVRSDPIEEIVPQGLRTSGQTFEFDDLILATGFDAVTGALAKIDIRGRDGLRLTEKWRDGPATFLGVATAGFPNMFLINGPGSPAAFANIATHTELNVEWVTDLIKHMTDQGTDVVDVNADSERLWSELVRETAERTLYPRANSWYVGANIPGKPRIFMFYVGGLNRYLEYARQVAEAGYPEFLSPNA